MIRKYSIYILGLYLVAFGVAMVLISGLGSSPISSWAYVMSLSTPLSVGFYSFIMNAGLILGQMLVLRGHGLRKELLNIGLQVPFSFLFGAFIDVNMYLLGKGFTPEAISSLAGMASPSYPVQLVYLLVGIFILSVGVLLEVRPQVTMMSGEAFVFYASRRWRREFGLVKIWFDCSLVVLAIVFAVGFSLKEGRDIMDAVLMVAREGTILAAILTGFFVGKLSAHARVLDEFLFGLSKANY